MTSTPQLVDYNGPLVMVYNKSSSCAMGYYKNVHDYIPRVTATCIKEKFIDYRLNLWKASLKTEDKKTEPTKYTTDEHVYFQCLFNNITIGNTTIRCPVYPFRIQISQEYTLGTYHHTVLNQTLTITEHLPSEAYIKLHPAIDIDDPTHQLALVENLKNKTREFEETLKFTPTYTAIIGGGSSLLTF